MSLVRCDVMLYVSRVCILHSWSCASAEAEQTDEIAWSLQGSILRREAGFAGERVIDCCSAGLGYLVMWSSSYAASNFNLDVARRR